MGIFPKSPVVTAVFKGLAYGPSRDRPSFERETDPRHGTGGTQPYRKLLAVERSTIRVLELVED